MAEVVSGLHGRFMPLPLDPGVAPHLRFQHFVGYGAQYYSYLFARQGGVLPACSAGGQS